MKMLLALKNKNYVVFFEQGEEEEATKLRKEDKRLKYARVIGIIQLAPSKIEMGKVYPRT